jgi:hypothetical protein
MSAFSLLLGNELILALATVRILLVRLRVPLGRNELILANASMQEQLNAMREERGSNQTVALWAASLSLELA